MSLFTWKNWTTNALEVHTVKRAFVSTALLLLGMTSPLFANSPAQLPYVTGRIEQDTTWRDTVYVGGDVTIAAGATLTLAPNTQVLFLPYRDETRGGLDTTRAELIVEGRLAAHAGGIVFRSADAGSLGADWHGLVVERGGRADVSYATIRDGLRCLYAERGGFVTMDSIAFANCGKPTTPADVAKPATPKGTERKEELGLSINATPSINQPFEIQEITIHINGEHKAVISALLAAVDEGTTVTGIAELDSLAATYGLIGIDRKGRISPFYGNRFRLRFPPGADGAAIAGDYGNLSYIQSTDLEPPPKVRRPFNIENPGLRLLAKVGAGVLGGSAGILVGFGILNNLDPDPDPFAAAAAVPHIVLIGCTLGSPIGVSAVDSQDKGILTWAGSMAGWVVGRMGVSDYWPLLYSPLAGAIIGSELWRKPPRDSQNSRVSLALSPSLNGGLSAVAQLRF